MEIGDSIIRGWELLDQTGEKLLDANDLEKVMLAIYYVTDPRIPSGIFAEIARQAALRFEERG